MDGLASCQLRYHLLRVLLAQIKLLTQNGCEASLSIRAASRESSAKVCE
jgi:hypothetical protein